MKTNLQTLLSDKTITCHLPEAVLRLAIEDEEKWAVRKVSGTIRVTDLSLNQICYWYKNHVIDRDDSEYADDRGFRSHDRFRFGRYYCTSLEEAKRVVDSYVNRT